MPHRSRSSLKNAGIFTPYKTFPHVTDEISAALPILSINESRVFDRSLRAVGTASSFSSFYTHLTAAKEFNLYDDIVVSTHLLLEKIFF